MPSLSLRRDKLPSSEEKRIGSPVDDNKGKQKDYVDNFEYKQDEHNPHADRISERKLECCNSQVRRSKLYTLSAIHFFGDIFITTGMRREVGALVWQAFVVWP